jgi:signal transduction histidine kinase
MGKWFEVEAFRTGEPGQHMVALLFADITERKQTEEMLKKWNEMLEERVRERTQQVRTLVSRLTMAEQEERRRISQILHDDLQQLLFGIEMKMGSMRNTLEVDSDPDRAKDWNDARNWIDQAISTARQLSVDLSPPILQNEGLANALEWLQSQMYELHRIHVEIESEHNWYIKDEDIRVLLFQIVRELLFNVKKHANVDSAVIKLVEENNRLVIHVIDNGQGFDVAESQTREDYSGGFGTQGFAPNYLRVLRL